MSQLPLTVLEKSLQKRVVILLKDQRALEGKLTGYDDHMNLVLEETDEMNGETRVRRLGVVVLRGSNVVTIAPK